MPSITSRESAFKEVWTLLNANAPTYTDKQGETKTYNVVASYPDTTPDFPILVINPVNKTTRRLGMKQSSNNLSAKGEVMIEFYAKKSDKNNAIDSAVDSVENTIETNNFSSLYLQREPFEQSDVDIVDIGGQKLNTVTLTVNITLR